MTLPFVLILLLVAAVLVVLVRPVLTGAKKAVTDVTNPQYADKPFPVNGVNATLMEKYLQNGGHWLLFSDDGGNWWNLTTSEKLYNAAKLRTRGLLLCDATGKQVAQFGSLMDSETEAAVLAYAVGEEGLPYYDDDFDELIDGGAIDSLEESTVYAQGEATVLSDEDRLARQRFLDAVPLPQQTIPLESRPRDLAGYKPEVLLESSGAPLFLRLDDSVRELFARLYKEALQELSYYESPPRSVTKGDLLAHCGNVFHLTLTVEENTTPLEHRIHGELGINTVSL